MKRLLILSGVLAAVISCTAKSSITITVTNPVDFARIDEPVEVKWSTIAKISGATPKNIGVWSEKSVIIPSQVLYNEDGVPEKLLFMVNIGAAEKLTFTVKRSEALPDFPARVYGRQVPERFDDYAWENELVAHRIYGEALADPQTQGLDVWSKSTDRLILNEWYASEDYHTNRGEGMDNYKVGNTLGGGASAFIHDEKILLAGNYVTCRTLANGPLRTSVELTYEYASMRSAPIPMRSSIGSFFVNYNKLVKTITLDAGTRFNRVEEVYTVGFSTIMLGMAEHNLDMERASTPNTIALGEWTSDHNKNIDPITLGRIYTAIVSPVAGTPTEQDGHLGLLIPAYKDRRSHLNLPIIYYVGSAWSLGGVEDFAAWQAEVERQLARLQNPLVVKIR